MVAEAGDRPDADLFLLKLACVLAGIMLALSAVIVVATVRAIYAALLTYARQSRHLRRLRRERRSALQQSLRRPVQ